MAFALHSRLTFSGVFGTLLAPYERWSFRVNLGPVTVGDVLGPGVVAAANAFNAHLQPIIGTTARLTQVKFARIGEDGKYTANPVSTNVDMRGNALGATYPSQVAMAVSLMTDTRGPSGRGRIYLPAPTWAVAEGTGVISEANAQTTANSVASFLGALNVIGEFANVCVASSKGTNQPVTGVRCGRVLDTIRSRRSQLVEGYTGKVAVSQTAG